jgi:hypothetical protein
VRNRSTRLPLRTLVAVVASSFLMAVLGLQSVRAQTGSFSTAIGTGKGQPARLTGAGLTTGASPGTSTPIQVEVDARKQPIKPVNEDLIGVNHVVPGSADPLNDIGTRWARTDISLEGTINGIPTYDCSTGAWDPALADSRVALDRSTGAEPEMIVDYTPPCLATNPPPGTSPNYSPPDVGPNASKWTHLVYEMALHEIGVEHVRVFEIWNEPNGFFWTGSLADYLTLYSNTALALEQAAHRLRVRILVGGPALADFGNQPELSWVDALLSLAQTSHLPLDFLSWHEYANDPYVGPIPQIPGGLCFGQPAGPGGACWYSPVLRAQDYGRGVQTISAEVAKYPGLHPILWLDEWNVDAGFDARQDGTYGGAFVAAVLDSVQATNLDRMCFYDTADGAGDPFASFGLLDSSLHPKPNYQVFDFWHELAGRQLPVELTPDQSAADLQGRIGAVASAGSDGAVKVLIYNFAPEGPSGVPGSSVASRYDHQLSVEVGGLDNQPYQLVRKLVDTSHRGSTVEESEIHGPGHRFSFDLQGQGVTLLVLRPLTGRD